MALLVLGTGPTTQVRWAAPEFAFAAITAAATLCLLGSAWLLWLGHRRDLAEVGLLGGGLVALSLLSLVHGLLVPGVVVGRNNASALASALAVPAALLLVVPLFPRNRAAARTVGRHWRGYAAVTLGALVAIAAVLLAAPSRVPAPPSPDAPVTIVGVVFVISATFRWSWSHLTLYRIGRRTASLLTAIAVAELGVVSITLLLPAGPTPAWWLAHMLDVTFTLVAVVGAAVAYPADRPFAELFAPVLERDPVVALELGLTPEIRAFVAALGTKDAMTREHVTRVADLATRLALTAGLRPEEVRAVGLGGLLHDIGKVLTPDTILTKPAGLTDAEFDVMRRHTVDGERILAMSPTADLLGPVATIVRWHHERFDGDGYPDGLARNEIPLTVSIVSVADAWDAMTATRHYRRGMDADRARRIIEDGAGSQWDPAAVALLLADPATRDALRPGGFALVGLSSPAEVADADVVCADALPAGTRPSP